MFAHLSRSRRRTALAIASLVSLVALGACANSATGPDRALPPEDLHATQRSMAPTAGRNAALVTNDCPIGSPKWPLCLPWPPQPTATLQ